MDANHAQHNDEDSLDFEDDEDDQLKRVARQFAIIAAPECVEGFVRSSSIVTAETPAQINLSEDFALAFSNQFVNAFMEAMGVSSSLYSLKMHSEHRDATKEKKSAWSDFKAAVKHKLKCVQSVRSGSRGCVEV